jgi:hypothetical protein
VTEREHLNPVLMLVIGAFTGNLIHLAEDIESHSNFLLGDK